MTLDIIVTTMHKSTEEIVAMCDRMNINSNVIVCNQANRFEKVILDHKNYKLTILTTDTRGLSLNRNIGIACSTADLLLFMDDDGVFVPNYVQLIKENFSPKMMGAKFIVRSQNADRPLEEKNKSTKKAKMFSLMSSGVCGFVIRRRFLLFHNLFFNVSYGAGTDMFCGEDSMFFKSLYRCTKSIYFIHEELATVEQSTSTWFAGYDDRYFCVKGYIYCSLYGFFRNLFFIRDYLLRKKLYAISWKKYRALSQKGVKQFLELKRKEKF